MKIVRNTQKDKRKRNKAILTERWVQQGTKFKNIQDKKRKRKWVSSPFKKVLLLMSSSLYDVTRSWQDLEDLARSSFSWE